MKVLLTSQSSALGGVEQRIVEEAQVLRAIDLEVAVAIPRFRNDTILRKKLESGGVQLLAWNPYKFVERDQTAWAFRALHGASLSQIVREHFSFAHVAMPWTTVGLSRVLQLVKAQVPVVLGIHCTFAPNQLSPEQLKYAQRALAGVIGAYAVSEPAATAFRAIYQTGGDQLELETIHNGVDTERFRPSAEQRMIWRHRLGIPPEALSLIQTGRLAENKHPEFAVNLIAALRGAGVAAHLILVGDGPLAFGLKRDVARRSLSNFVHFLGFRDDVEDILASGDLGMASSDYFEGFPLAPSEALASGMPVLIPADPVFQSCFGACEVAHLLTRETIDMWVQIAKWYAAMTIEERAIRSLKARNFAVSSLSVLTMRAQLTDFYRRVIQKLHTWQPQ